MSTAYQKMEYHTSDVQQTLCCFGNSTAQGNMKIFNTAWADVKIFLGMCLLFMVKMGVGKS